MYITTDATLNTAAIVHAIGEHIRAFTSGEMRQFWPHLILLGGALVGEVAVAFGIILESPKEKELRERVGMAFVLGGVFLSAVFTIGLFVFDEGVSNVQQSSIAILTKQAQDAQTSLAKTTVEAANANERAAEIMRATAWRGFTAQQANALVSDLSGHSGKIMLGWVLGDPESLSLAIQFSKVLQATGEKWDIAPDGEQFPDSLVWGIRIPDAPGAKETAWLLRKAFTDARIHFDEDDIPKTTGFGWTSPNGKAKDDRALIFFGSKRPTVTQPPL